MAVYSLASLTSLQKTLQIHGSSMFIEVVDKQLNFLVPCQLCLDRGKNQGKSGVCRVQPMMGERWT